MLLKTENENNHPWDEILLPENEDELMQRDAQILMFRFLSEIERFQQMHGVNRKNLAEEIKTSASYLTQLFRGDKPLNFISIAKMQKALDIVFEIKAKSKEEISQTSYNAPAPVFNLSGREKPVDKEETTITFKYPDIKKVI